MTDARSTYIFAERLDPAAVLAVPGVRAVMTLANVGAWSYFVGMNAGVEDEVLALCGGDVSTFEEPIPDYPPSWPTRIVHCPPAPSACRAISIEAGLPDSAFVEEASLTTAGAVLVLWSAPRFADIAYIATRPSFVIELLYDESEALVEVR